MSDTTTFKLASERHRTLIQELCNKLGWSAEKRSRWLAERGRIYDLAGGAFTKKTASRAIRRLLAASRNTEGGS